MGVKHIRIGTVSHMRAKGLKTMKSLGWCAIAVRRLMRGATRNYRLDRQVSLEIVAQMDQDLPRTATAETLVGTHKGHIRAMLLRLAADDPALGYCQGLNFVAAAFAAAAVNRTEAYLRFHTFVNRVRGLWLPGFPLLHVGEARFVSVAKDRLWYQHFETHNVEPSMFLPQALLTMFSLWLPLPTVVKCLPLPEDMGLEAMIAITLVVLEHAQERLLRQRSLEGILKVLHELPSFAPNPQAITRAVKSTLPLVHQSAACL